MYKVYTRMEKKALNGSIDLFRAVKNKRLELVRNN